MAATKKQVRDGTVWMSKSDVATEYSVSEWTVRKWVSSGQLPAYRLGDGNLLRFRRSDVEQLLHPVPTSGGAS